LFRKSCYRTIVGRYFNLVNTLGKRAGFCEWIKCGNFSPPSITVEGRSAKFFEAASGSEHQ
jgi:hypothetical protein